MFLEIGAGGGDGGVRLAVELHGHTLGDPLLLHGHAVERAGDAHCALVVGDHDELRVTEEILDDRGEAGGVGFIERGIDFVEDAERRRLRLEDRHDQRHGGHLSWK